jgi:Kef-type K+ transport system membrane component KefB
MEGMALVERAAHLLAQLGFMLLVAKLFGEVFERYLKQSPVLGELVGGMIIGPYALGHLIHIPGMHEPLFAIPHGHAGGIPLSPELWGVAQLAAVLLLFGAGLETDFSLFLRFGLPAFVVAMGGVIFPFFFGVFLTIAFGYANSVMHPSALFMGAVMTATSVGITARVLSELGRLGTPEGVTILAAAVIDDVLGIIVLAIVTSIVQVGEVEAIELGKIAIKAFGFWLILTGILVAIAPTLAKIFRRFKGEGALIGLALALCFLIASLTESVGKLAMIIGAYALGLAFSRTELREDLEHALRPLIHGLVPVFFVAMGMLVNFSAMSHAFWFGVGNFNRRHYRQSFRVRSPCFGCQVQHAGGNSGRYRDDAARRSRIDCGWDGLSIQSHQRGRVRRGCDDDFRHDFPCANRLDASVPQSSFWRERKGGGSP